MMYKLSKRSYSRLDGINAILIAILTESIKDSPYDFGIPRDGGMRTSKRQNELYKARRSQLDGYDKKSYHQSGKAFDIYGYVNGDATWDKDILESIARHIQRVAEDKFNVVLIWGGDWDNDGIRVDKDSNERFFDGAHFQID